MLLTYMVTKAIDVQFCLCKLLLSYPSRYVLVFLPLPIRAIAWKTRSNTVPKKPLHKGAMSRCKIHVL